MTMIPVGIPSKFAKYHFDIFYKIIDNKQGFSLLIGENCLIGLCAAVACNNPRYPFSGSP